MPKNIPTEMYISKNAIAENPEHLTAAKRAFIVTGKHGAKASGALSDVTAVLDGAGIPYSVFDGVTENPSVGSAYRAGNEARAFGADTVIGIGGGSAIDAAKAIAAFAENELAFPEDIFDPALCVNLPLPVIAVPTTAGTGSEANPYSILSVDSARKKRTFKSPYSYPISALVDYRYTRSLGRDYSVSCALDALAHGIESFISPKSTPYSEDAALEAASEIWKVLFCGEDGEGENDVGGFTEIQRERLMRASNLAGCAIAVTGTGFPHPLGYNLTMEKGVPHGRACGAFEGEYIRLNMSIPEGAKKLERLFCAAGASAEEMIKRIPDMADVHFELTDDEITDFVSRTENAANYANSPYVISRSEMVSLYRKLFPENS